MDKFHALQPARVVVVNPNESHRVKLELPRGHNAYDLMQVLRPEISTFNVGSRILLPG